MTSTDLVLAANQTAFTQTQLATLAQLGIKDATDGDLAIFFHQCKRTGLDPFAKQIYMIGRYSTRDQCYKQTIQTGIDGYRLIAERTGKYCGSEEHVYHEKDLLISATVTVRKVVAEVVGEFTATALYREYCQRGKDGKPMGLWATMPERMLIKCAEALALRKAFPQDLFGIVTAEEMGQTDSEPLQLAPVDADPLITNANKERFKASCTNIGLRWQDVLKLADIDDEEWKILRESGRRRLLEAYERAKDDALTGPVSEDTEIVEQPPVVTPVSVGPMATRSQIAALKALCRGAKYTDDEQASMASDYAKRIVIGFDELTEKEAAELVAILKAKVDEGG